MPWPPPMQAEPMAYFLFWRMSSCVRCAVMRAPEAPSGWPMAMAPPLALVISRLRPSSFSQARYCAAKASLISTMSIWSSVMPAAASTPRMASTGPMPMVSGSQPTRFQATTRASGAMPWAAQASSEATTSEAAPSQMPEAEPAVTRPSFLNTGGSLAMAAMSALRPRGCSSALTVSMARFTLTSTGAISASKTPASAASA
mmetsp:Transcript_31128/g.98790  ORF Transcript_31128/g.98790 Transcript_31128/m.98790 type:complete len:201 (+) Transcript_31128:1340-1942(+)